MDICYYAKVVYKLFMEEVERTSTMIVAKVIKEDPRLQI
jgi:hypothetical protein